MFRALDKVESSKGVNTYNLGTGKGYSVLEMVEAFARTSGREIPYKIIDRRPGDIPLCFAETTKANVELGWRAERGLNEMCEDTWRWQSLNPSGYEKSYKESEASVPSKAAEFFVIK